MILDYENLSVSVNNGGYNIVDNYESVTLKLVSGSPSDKILVLVNGDEYCKFNSYESEININTQSVIEIYNCSDSAVTVETASVSENIEVLMNNGNVKVEGIETICRVKVKNK